MRKIDKNAFLNAIKNVTSSVPCSLKNSQAKEVVSIAVRESGIPLKDALEYMQALCDIPSTFTEKEWNRTINYHVNWSGNLGRMLKNFKKVTEEQFTILATGCGMDASLILAEDKIDVYGWLKVLDVLKKECEGIVSVIPAVKTEAEEPVKPVMESSMTKRIIVMKDYTGAVVREFKTSKEASETMEISYESIRKGLSKNPGSYRFNTSKKDGKKYSFEYQEVAVSVPAKTTRKYVHHKIAVLNTETGDVKIYDNACKAASALGIKNDEVYYRANAAKHRLNENIEIWFEDALSVATAA